MSQDAEKLRQEADRLRTLAKNLTDRAVLDAIRLMVEELEKRARLLDLQ